jgi:hypothetical protein
MTEMSTFRVKMHRAHIPCSDSNHENSPCQGGKGKASNTSTKVTRNCSEERGRYNQHQKQMEARTQEGDKLGLRARAGKTTKIIKKKNTKSREGLFRTWSPWNVLMGQS